MRRKGLYIPSKRSIRQAAALTAEAVRRGFNAKGIEMDRHQQDVTDQAEQQIRDDTLQAQAREHHAQFLTDQHARFVRFQKLLGALRAIYRDDPVMQTMLAEFRRERSRNRTKDAEPEPEPSPLPSSPGQQGSRTTAMA